MNHIIQVARRTGKHAVGYKVQLVIHRMTADLPESLHNAPLCAVIKRHKKRACTKSAPYVAETKEVVWGSILPCSCTLYLAKTGLYQSKVFQVHVVDAKSDRLVAAFEFNLSDLIRSGSDSSKENLLVRTTKCQDASASLALTVISTKATASGDHVRSPDEQEGSYIEEMSFDGSCSEMSSITVGSRSSHVSYASAHPTGVAQLGVTVKPLPPSPSSAASSPTTTATDTSESAELVTLKAKYQDLVRVVQDLEEQLRSSEKENVALAARLEVHDLTIQRIDWDKAELEHQVVDLERRASAVPRMTASSVGELTPVDFHTYLAMKNKYEVIRDELDSLKVTIASSGGGGGARAPHRVNEGSEGDDRRSESSSGNEYHDASDPQLTAELEALRRSLAAVNSEREELQNSVTVLIESNNQLMEQSATLQGTTEELESTNREQMQRIVELEAHAKQIQDDQAGGHGSKHQSNAVAPKWEHENEMLREEVDELQQLVKNVEMEKVALSSKLELAGATCLALESDLHQSKHLLEHVQEENRIMANRMKEEQSTGDTEREELKCAQLTIDELRAQLHEMAKHERTMEERRDFIANEAQLAAATAVAEVTAKNAELESHLGELKQQNDRLQCKLEELHDRLAEAQKVSDGADGETGGAEQDLRKRVADLERENEYYQNELMDCKMELHEHIQRASDKEAPTDRDGERCADDEKLADALSKNQEMQHERDEMKIQNDELMAQLTELQERIEDLRVGYDTEGGRDTSEAALREQLSELELESEHYRRELVDTQEELQRVSELLQASKSRHHVGHDDGTAADVVVPAALTAAIERNNELQAEVNKLKMQNKALTVELEECQEITGDRRAKTPTSVESTGVSHGKGDLEKRVHELETENEYFQTELIDSKMKLAELNARNEEITGFYYRMKRQLSALKVSHE